MNSAIERADDRSSRRDFIKSSAVASAVTVAGTPISARSSSKIRVGLVGCGRRGTQALIDMAEASQDIEIIALGELFEDRLQESIARLRYQKGDPYPWDAMRFQSRGKRPMLPDCLKITPETCFTGFDAYKKVINSGVDAVLLACPPHFRARHMRAAVEAGKHVWIEKPVATDPVGVRSIIESSEIASEKNLSVLGSTENRRRRSYIETIKRIHNGAIGDIISGQLYFVMGDYFGGARVIDRQSGWSDMEYQCRNWLYFTWLSGDFFVEIMVHHLDVVNWVMGSHPVKALGTGGRQSHTDPKFGNLYDHYTVVYEYPNGAEVTCIGRQAPDTSTRSEVCIYGTKGKADPSKSIEGDAPFTYKWDNSDPHVQEHREFVASIQQGKPLAEGRRVAESTLTGIMGRMSAYTGQEATWDWVLNESQLDLSPERYEFKNLPVRPLPVPGKTPLR